jgi:hypothetical protein
MSDEKSIKNVDLKRISVQSKEKETNILKNKIKFVSKIAKMQKTLREESENIVKIKVNFLYNFFYYL